MPHLLKQSVEPANVCRLPGHLVGQIAGLGALLPLHLAALQGRKGATFTKLLHTKGLQRKGEWQLQQSCLRQCLLCMALLRLVLLQHRALLVEGPAKKRAMDANLCSFHIDPCMRRAEKYTAVKASSPAAHYCLPGALFVHTLEDSLLTTHCLAAQAAAHAGQQVVLHCLPCTGRKCCCCGKLCARCQIPGEGRQHLCAPCIAGH